MSVGGDVRTLIAGVLRRAAFPAAALLLVLAIFLPGPASAQNALAMSDYGMGATVKPKPGSQMLVEAEELVYDYDHDTVSAVGNVKIYYVGYTLEADRVSYNKGTAKLVASGNVKMTDPSGLVVYANDIDITEDFRDGFVESLRVDTPDQTHFAATSAQREEGERTTFVNGVYTACEPCKDHPERPPLWQVKAKRIISDQQEKMIYFHNATFEFYGVPLAWIPYFSTADPSVKRKTGFLAPLFAYSEPLGWSVSTPYFIALAPNYDVTLTPSYYSEQGFMGAAEWRQRLANGQFSLQMAGINQENPDRFLVHDDAGNVIGGTFAQRDFRGGARSTGQFAINQFWTFAWDGTISTDRTFTRNYKVLNEDTSITQSYAALTGLRDRDYFDARAEYFQVLTDSTDPKYDQGRQAVVTPVIDHDYIFDRPFLGGQVELTSNLTYLTREESDPFWVGPTSIPVADRDKYFYGLAGDYFRISHELDWERKIVGPGGQLITPFASLRGDFYAIDAHSDPSSPDGNLWPGLTNDRDPTRVMPTAGVEWSWPILVTAGNTSHVIEPIAQIVARPNEPLAGELPNDDAQSLVFDDFVLFRHDKFSGYDRVEGGTRVNYGIRYIGTFPNDIILEGLFGQSRMLAGENSFAVKNVADVGAMSGLETDVSDYVSRVSLDTPAGRLDVRGRFDEETFALQRAEVEASKTTGSLTASASYVYVREEPSVGIDRPLSTITGSASVQVWDRWRLFGSAVYDITGNASTGKHVARESVGLAYDDSCVSLSVAFTETHKTDIPDRAITLKLLLRTLAEGNVNASISPASNTN